MDVLSEGEMLALLSSLCGTEEPLIHEIIIDGQFIALEQEEITTECMCYAPSSFV